MTIHSYLEMNLVRNVRVFKSSQVERWSTVGRRLPEGTVIAFSAPFFNYVYEVFKVLHIDEELSENPLNFDFSVSNCYTTFIVLCK